MMIRKIAAILRVLRDFRTPLPDLEPRLKRRLRRVLVSAYENVPHYRSTMRGLGYDPRVDFSGPEDLRLLPILTKGEIKEAGYRRFLHEGADRSRCHETNTSGSSGEPFRVWRSQRSQSLMIAKYLRVLVANGYRLTHKVLGFRPLSKPVVEEGAILRHLGLVKWRKVDFNLSPTAMADLLFDYQPDFLYGNLVHMELIGQELERRGTRYTGLQAVLPGGEVVTEGQRRRLGEVFGSQVSVTYGSEEVGVISFGTPGLPGMELCEDLLLTELLDGDGQPVEPGEVGRVIVTDLTNDVMPFIRYDQGDWSELETEASGAPGGWRRLRAVHGRANESFQLSDGSMFTYVMVSRAMKRYPRIKQFRAIQKERDCIHIQLAGDRGYIQSIRNPLSLELARQSPPVAKLVIVPVERILPDEHGKLRILVSEVA